MIFLGSYVFIFILINFLRGEGRGERGEAGRERGEGRLHLNLTTNLFQLFLNILFWNKYTMET